MPAGAQKSDATTPVTPVPPLNLAASFKQVREEVLAEITAICDSGYYVLGPKVAAFEDVLAAYCGRKHALGVSSGTDALLLAMMTLGIGPRDEVIVPAFTFFATAGCVARLGARPVLCDIDPRTYNIDVGQVEEKLTMQTKAVVPVHLYGQLADMRPLLSAVNRHGIAVIEDAAQAIGARESGPDGKRAGGIGTFGCISFYPTKNLGAIGDAGALLTDDDKLHEKATKLRLHGETTRYHHALIGGNFRIDPIQAAILTVKLKHLDQWNGRRRKRAACYNELLTGAGLVPEHVQLPADVASNHVYHQYVIRADRRDELIAYLHERKIGAGIYYPVPLHMQECFAYLKHKPGDFPHSEKAAAEVLALPIYPELTDPQQEAVVTAIRDFYRR
jgi:dTDP-4-amino-4,6-dideoxygalactose transaminase